MTCRVRRQIDVGKSRPTVAGTSVADAIGHAELALIRGVTQVTYATGNTRGEIGRGDEVVQTLAAELCGVAKAVVDGV